MTSSFCGGGGGEFSLFCEFFENFFGKACIKNLFDNVFSKCIKVSLL
jgi:hypothetical protein